MKLKRHIKYYLLRLFRLKASPHQVAMGLTLGFIPNWFPTFGLGPILSVGLAKLTRVNLVAAFMGGLIGTPLWPFLFLLNYRFGNLFMNNPGKEQDLEDVEYIDAVGSLQSGSIQFLSGAVFNILVSSLIIYLLAYLLFKKYRAGILDKLKKE